MLAFFYIAFAVMFRLVPHGPLVSLCQSCGLWNFTPVGASLLFFGARQDRRRWWIPVAAFALSDVVLNLFIWHVRLDWGYAITWTWYAAALLVGSSLRLKVSVMRLVAASAVLSLSFFVLSNFAVWAAGTMYPHTLSGLFTCYTLALPFFRNTAAGDLIFSAAMFGLPAAAAALNRQRLAVSS
ncbi:MAG: hypothetical protein JO041_15465 [Acidobacteria bacterium]|nr:hypothetical protein [Acidobacteriota bacterium]